MKSSPLSRRVDYVISEISVWFESNRQASGAVNTNVMTAGLILANYARNGLPVSEESIRTKSQVKGLTGSAISKILKAHGESRPFTSEGGRTSRGTLPIANSLRQVLNKAAEDEGFQGEDIAVAASEVERFFVEQLQREYFDKQTIDVDIDPAKPVSVLVADILDAADQRKDQVVGIVAQHLVGAKLQLRFPCLEVGRDKGHAADQQTGRGGDFDIGNTAFHVTIAPMEKLVDRCRANLRNRQRPVVLVPQGRVIGATQILEVHGLIDRVGIQSIETFVGTNIEEIATYERDAIELSVARFVRTYNDRINDIEVDGSLRITEPEWISSHG
ncbi:DUF4928 domain-containing protein [Brevibacterium aurantiacum]|uniref:DUF4928 family protein n=1 Tax=Brevibacterium aurantiacum TaxID=273384 RepID=UPI000DF3B363|nr:DUF4928 family protein [Brevibacterium aurantiacum]RCS97776.1 DUF4928 domain-containing protein [Brevibacterium aurantiacum]